MAARCTTSSAVLALPTVLRNVLRAEFAPVVFHNHLWAPRSSLSPRKLPCSRTFSSVSPVHSAQHPEPAPAIAKPAVDANSSGPSPQTRTNATGSNGSGHSAPKRQRGTKDSNGAVGKKKQARRVSVSKDQTANSKTGAGKMTKLEPWRVQKEALKKKFPGGWNPPKKLSPDALEGIRHLHRTAPDRFTTAVLAEQFKVSPEAIRRIIKSKWRASEEETEDRRKRWENRHERIWSRMAELGLRPHTQRSAPISDSQVLYDEKTRN